MLPEPFSHVSSCSLHRSSAPVPQNQRSRATLDSACRSRFFGSSNADEKEFIKQQKRMEEILLTVSFILGVVLFLQVEMLKRTLEVGGETCLCEMRLAKSSLM